MKEWVYEVKGANDTYTECDFTGRYKISEDGGIQLELRTKNKGLVLGVVLPITVWVDSDSIRISQLFKASEVMG